MSSIQRVGVVGGGIMGSGIAEVCLRAGCDVVVVEADGERAAAALQRVEDSLQRATRKGLDSAAIPGLLDRLSAVTDLDALADRQLVVEAVAEDEGLKTDVFRRLDAIVAPDALLTSNTSSIPVARLAAVTGHPDRVMGLHFFNPVPVMALVELVPALQTAEDTVRRVEAFATTQLDKRAIQAPDRAGFVVNALLVPYLVAAIRMYEAGLAAAEDIDAGMVEGCGHPMGPLALCDLIGLDTALAIADSLYAEFRDPAAAPPPLLRRMVEAGHLGRKAGRGFYRYE